MPHTIVYAMVPIARAHAAAVISSSPWRPISTTSSPTSTGQVADVEHELIHRDRAGDRAAPAAHDRLAAVMRAARGAHRRRNRSARSRRGSRRVGLVAQPVREPRAARNRLHVRDPRLHRHRRAQLDAGLRARRPARGRSSRCRRAPCRSARRASRSRRRCCTRARSRSAGRGRAARRAPSRNGASCSAVYGLPGSSATARCVHTPASSSSGRSTTCAASSTASSARAPDAMHARVDLQVHAEPVAGAAIGDRLGERVDPGERVHDRREPVAARRSAPPRGPAPTARGSARRCRPRGARFPLPRARRRDRPRRPRARRARPGTAPCP